jgi:hypothetical protein
VEVVAAAVVAGEEEAGWEAAGEVVAGWVVGAEEVVGWVVAALVVGVEGAGFWVREVARLCPPHHQTPLVQPTAPKGW